MSTDIYHELLEVMQARGGAYSGLDIPEFLAMAKAMFTPEEVRVNNAMPKGYFTAQTLAGILGDDTEQVEQILDNMAQKGLCMAFPRDGEKQYLRARFMTGILEFQFMKGSSTAHDKKMAQLIHNYKMAYEKVIPPTDIPKGPSTIRVLTVDSTIESGSQVHTYDQVQTYIDANEHIALTTCYCRHAAILRGEDVHGLPTDTCLQFGPSAEYAIHSLDAKRISKKEPREILDRCETLGLVHMSENWTDKIGFICNCDPWHCVGLRTTLASPQCGTRVNSGFEPQFAHENCTQCEVCIERCPADALELEGTDLPEINLDRCIGCAACATGCPGDAIVMVPKKNFPKPAKTVRELMDTIKAAYA